MKHHPWSHYHGINTALVGFESRGILLRLRSRWTSQMRLNPVSAHG